MYAWSGSDRLVWFCVLYCVCVLSVVRVGNFLARGTLLRNTDWVVAGVVYTGPDTKMSLNVRPPPNKFSSIDRRMNRVVIVLFSFMFSLIIGIVLASFFFEQASSPNKYDLRSQCYACV